MSTSPRRIGQYELMQQIGSGHIGEVWKARDLAQQRDVAIKLLHNDLQADPHFLNRLTNGGRALTTIRHSNLVSVYDAAVSRPQEARETTAFIAMDYIEGYTFADYLKATAQRGIFPAITDILYIFSCLGDALDAIHQRGIAHGNIKPTNILLHKQQRGRFSAGEPLLTDVGITQIAGNDSSMAAPHYLSPEQAQGQQANARSDIYALGILLYELCTGALPFRGDNTFAVISQQINTLPTPPMLINANIPATLSEVILRALAKDPAARFPEASLLAIAIAEACSIPTTHPSLRQNAGRSGPLATPGPSMPNNVQSILGVSQPLSNDSPAYRRPLRSNALPLSAQGTSISLNSNPNISAALIFPNSGPLPAISPIASSPSQSNSVPPQPEAPASSYNNHLDRPFNVNQNSMSGMLPEGNANKQLFMSPQSLSGIPATENNAVAPQVPFSLPPSTPNQQAAYEMNTTQQPSQQPPRQPYAQASQNQMPATPYPPSAQNAGQDFYGTTGQHQGPSAPYQQEPAQTPMANQGPMPFPQPPASASAHTTTRKNKYLVPLMVALIVLIILGTVSITKLLTGGQGNQGASTNLTPTSTAPGLVFFQDDALGHNDQLRITMNNIPDPQADQTYFAWLQTDTHQNIPLSNLQVNNKNINYTYSGDSKHSNLLSYTTGIIITTEATGTTPQNPSSKIVYQATMPTTLLPEIKNILYATPELGGKRTAVADMLDSVKSMNDKAGSIVDSLQGATDTGLVKRQATRIIEMIDDSKYARQSGQLPANLSSQINTPIGLLSAPDQKGYIDILSAHLTTLKTMAGNDSDLMRRITNVQNGLTDLKQWLQEIQRDDVQLLKATNLKDPAITNVALHLKQLVSDTYTGHIIPPDTSPKPILGSAGALQVYTEAQYMASLTLQAIK
ncbi:serine/threonine protein kinase [Dictyobacter arantiisoli]|uniref:non-specific serine/threonine protein kinase n=1 Tax=Dictyobacter arantiisoli TaxID=2014874 RepID=A0A5A5T5K6_9CHLR|nr:serine/threonine-protein kinase [Dictyobacter arantiisoli]GCF06608.1 hypothetical protein KDI_01720 [Dictyobacter arantiisoli]